MTGHHLSVLPVKLTDKMVNLAQTVTSNKSLTHTTCRPSGIISDIKLAITPQVQNKRKNKVFTEGPDIGAVYKNISIM